MEYEFFPLSESGVRRSETYTPGLAAQRIGERVILGFPVVQRDLRDRSLKLLTVVYFQSAETGKVWALYYS